MTLSLPTVVSTDFSPPGLKSLYRGKVRDVYFFENHIAVVATDRISAFDHILPEPIPGKGQILNQMAAYFLNSCSDLVPIWLESTPDPNISAGKRCSPIKIEMVIRGYLVGHAWREYRDGRRQLCGVPLPDGLRENEPFAKPIITPATKADEGHDEDISKDEIIRRKLVDPSVYEQMESLTYNLFDRGSQMAKERGLILVDTKYEFGLDQKGRLTLIDEIHTPDSSRYFFAAEYEENLRKGKRQNHLSKEFVREWLISKNFSGQTGQVMPSMDPEIIDGIRSQYIRLYQLMTGKEFVVSDTTNLMTRIEKNLKQWCLENGIS